MNRCTRYLAPLPSLLPGWPLLCLALAALPAAAQTDAGTSPANATGTVTSTTTIIDPGSNAVIGTVRQFPAGVRRGEMVVQQPPEITMDGKPDRLSVGSRIRDANNHLVLSAQIVGQKLVVNYLRENGGPVHQAWILSSDEAKVRMPGTKRSWFDVLSGQPADDAATTTTTTSTP